MRTQTARPVGGCRDDPGFGADVGRAERRDEGDRAEFDG